MRKHHKKNRNRVNAGHLNGSKGTGCHTGEGKRRSAMNALKHGLDALSLLLSTEDPEKWERHLRHWDEYLQPINAIEAHLVREIAVHTWHQARIWGIETGSLNHLLEEQAKTPPHAYSTVGGHTATAFAYRAQSETGLTQTINRHLARLSREYTRALNTLFALRANVPPGCSNAPVAPFENENSETKVTPPHPIDLEPDTADSLSPSSSPATAPPPVPPVPPVELTTDNRQLTTNSLNCTKDHPQ